MRQPRLSPRAFLRTLPLLTLLLPTAPLAAQCTVTSSTGYVVHLSVQPLAIVPSGSTCTSGYNYNVRIAYSIYFTGSNIPASLYTLQGTIGCTGASPSFFDLPNNGGSGTTTTTGNQWRAATDCHTSTVASLGCNGVNVEINGPGISSRTVSCAFTTLPITLLDFDAQPDGDEVMLHWTTATERNNALFTVERSVDGQAFEPVAEMPGAGNSQHAIHYATVDAHPQNGIAYYRLKQTDYDGAFKYSDEVVVDMKLENDGLSAYPNPANTDVFTLSEDVIGDRLDVYSPTGAWLFGSTLTATRVEHPHLPPGVYVLQVTDVNGQRRRTIRLAQE